MTEEAQAPRDEGSRTYRPKLIWQLVIGLGGACGSGLGVAFAAGALRASHEPSWVAPLMGAICIAFGVLALVLLATDRIVLHGRDEIELRQLGFGHHRLRREEIKGRRLLPTQYIATLVLERTDGRRPVKIALTQKRDEVLNAFLDSLTDLDQVDRAAAEKALLMQLEELGATDDERRRALASGHRIARVLNGIAVVAILWGYIYPRPYTLVVLVLAALPLAALMLLALGRGVFATGGKRNDPRPQLVPVMMGPPLVLLIRSVLDVSLVDLSAIACVAAVVAVAFVAFEMAVRPPDERGLQVILALALTAAMYGWGVASLANVLPDRRRPPQTYVVEVRGERVSSGSHPSAYLTLAPWGPIDAEAEYAVPRAVHDGVEVGGDACAHLHPGFLGARWYVIRRCE